MRFDIRIQKLDLMQAVAAYIERRLRSSAGAFERYIHRVSVRLSDTNGERGVANKCCRITAHFGRHETVIVEEVDSDPLAAVDRAAERLIRTFARRLRRSRVLRAGSESVRMAESSLQYRSVAEHEASLEGQGNTG
jgi:ribosome-associated translation inhibitor RaiA